MHFTDAAQLLVEPYSYDTHVQYIAALKTAQRAEALSHARHKFAEHFPLTPSLSLW